MASAGNASPIEPAAQSPEQSSNLVTLQNHIAALKIAPSGAAQTGGVAHIDLARLQQSGIVTPLGGRSRVLDEYRIIKRPILSVAASHALSQENRPNLVMVTSARPGEGKTFTAISLAMSIVAEGNIQVLLVDLDIARQDLCKRLGIASEIGLINLLNDTSLALPDVLVKTDVPRLSVLPAGADQPLAHELLAGPKMRLFLDSLSNRYQGGLVIFDVAPVLASADTSILAANVGQIIMVVEANRTNRASVEEVLSLLDDCPHISFVLNKVEASEMIDQYGSYYGESYGGTSMGDATLPERIGSFIGKHLRRSNPPG